MPARIVILEEDELIRELLQEMCEQQGCEVIAYPNPGLCPLHVEHRCPCAPHKVCADGIICDLRMPLVQGLDFLESLRSKGCLCQRIALLSGAFEAEDIARATRLGCQVIAKPFKIQEIMDWLEQVNKVLAPHRSLYDWDV